MLADLIIPSSFSIIPYCLLCLFAMVEGPTAALIGGAASASGYLNLYSVYVAIVLGNLIADMGWYSIGRFNKTTSLNRLLAKFNVSPQRIALLEEGIHKNAPRLLFFAKLTVGFPIPILIATGISQVRIYRWIFFLFLGELIKSAVLIGIGNIFSQTIQKTSNNIQEILWGITLIILITSLIWLKRRQKRNELHS